MCFYSVLTFLLLLLFSFTGVCLFFAYAFSFKMLVVVARTDNLVALCHDVALATRVGFDAEPGILVADWLSRLPKPVLPHY